MVGAYVLSECRFVLVKKLKWWIHVRIFLVDWRVFPELSVAVQGAVLM